MLKQVHVKNVEGTKSQWKIHYATIDESSFEPIHIRFIERKMQANVWECAELMFSYDDKRQSI